MPAPSQPNGVSMLKAFKASGEIGVKTLVYDNLENVAHDASVAEGPLISAAFEAPVDSIEEEKHALVAAIGSLVMTGQQLRDPELKNKELISDRFTQHSIEIYGRPEEGELKTALGMQYQSFAALKDNPNVDQTLLGQLLGTLEAAGAPADNERDLSAEYKETSEAMSSYLKEFYGDSLDVFDELEASSKQPSLEETRELMEQALARMHSAGKMEDWPVVIDSAEGMQTLNKSKRFVIGDRGNYAPERHRPLMVHEFGHGIRAMRGSQTGDSMMQNGLPGSADFDEGLMTFYEYSISGIIPDKNIDRYVSVGLALGISELPAMNRQQQHDFHAARMLLRKQAAGAKVDTEAINTAAWNLVDRIYRGSLGNDLIGVNTKDAAYHPGFLQAADYIKQELGTGKAPQEIFDYVMQGNFDPTNPRHREYVARLKK